MFVLLGSEWPIGILYRPIHVYWQASRDKTLNQSWPNVCPTMVDKCWTNIDSMSPCVSWVLCMPLGQTDHTAFTDKHAYRWTITCSQRYTNAGTPSTTLAQHLVSVAVLGLLLMTRALPGKHETLTQCCFNAGRRQRRLASMQTTLDHSRSRVVYSTGSLVLLC